jgi:puromycin-sensitive aminopeptidase
MTRGPKAHRLPKHVRPERYHVDIAVHPAWDEFHGTAAIDLSTDREIDRVEMHAKGLAIEDPFFAIGSETFDARTELHADTETVVFIAPRPLPSGRFRLIARFSGKPNPGMHGLYLAKDGSERAICTQCEATDARGIFPCFDEPEFKAKIAWTIRSRTDVVALANGSLEKTEEIGDEKVWHFAETDLVSSYLAAIAVGDFEGSDPTRADGIPVRVWAMRGKKAQTKFAHEFTAKLIPWFESYFDEKYAYEKYDQVAVPGFDAGAMENVGLVLFRQNLLLMDPEAASWNQEKLIAKVIAHELAHMWFGNLVTMKWWDDLWLNEAFAEWFAHKATHANAPDYQVWNDFQADKNRALIDDALPTTHPIYAPVQTPGEAIEMFDVITYQKGCAVMRMLENFLDEEAFRTGIRTYMKAFARKNAAGKDLWDHLAHASGQPVGELMKSWIEQPGFPMVKAELDGAKLLLSQRRFFSSPAASEQKNDQLWNVPLVIRFEDRDGVKMHRFILEAQSKSVALPANGPVKWCYPNADEIGFYRVDAGGVSSSALSPVEQMGLIEDQWALVRNASSTIARFLPVVTELAKSQDHNVVRAVVDRLGTLDRVLEEAGDDRALTQFRAYLASLFEAEMEALGYEPKKGESQNDVQRRALTIHAMAGLARVAGHVERCEHWAELEQKDPRSVDPNLAGTFVGIAAKFGDMARYRTWVATYLERKSKGAAPQDSLRYLYTLASFRPTEITAETLAHLDDGVIPQEAVGSILSQLLGTRHARLATWDHLRAHWDALKPRVGDMGVSRVVEAVGSLPGDRRGEIVSFFESHPPVGAERALARALETLDQREELYRRIIPQLVAFLG